MGWVRTIIYELQKTSNEYIIDFWHNEFISTIKNSFHIQCCVDFLGKFSISEPILTFMKKINKRKFKDSMLKQIFYDSAFTLMWKTI